MHPKIVFFFLNEPFPYCALFLIICLIFIIIVLILMFFKIIKIFKLFFGILHTVCEITTISEITSLTDDFSIVSSLSLDYNEPITASLPHLVPLKTCFRRSFLFDTCVRKWPHKAFGRQHQIAVWICLTKTFTNS